MTIRDTNADYIEVERRAFMETSNPMHVWAAFRFARVVRAEIPDWVIAYLDLASKRLLALAVEEEQKHAQAKQVGKRHVTDVKRVAPAFFIKASHLAGYHDNWVTYGMNVRHLKKQKHQETYAIDHVADHFGVSASTVRRAWKQYEKLYPGDAIFPEDAVLSKTRPDSET
ncbi:hypothetical protein [Mesorhizobium sp. CN2-181]|uniref:hypothetical protein n=1 Tax=Mesorhizobium yinganensis TaxID=3157707 RepID=UPI0032B7C5EA